MSWVRLEFGKREEVEVGLGHGDGIAFGNGDGDRDIAVFGDGEGSKFGEVVSLKMLMGLALELALRIM